MPLSRNGAPDNGVKPLTASSTAVGHALNHDCKIAADAASPEPGFLPSHFPDT
ncbi:MAG: hypothetical protein ACRCS9_03700 [Hyphomicrobium sp.]